MRPECHRRILDQRVDFPGGDREAERRDPYDAYLTILDEVRVCERDAVLYGMYMPPALPT
jgi:hypothetical protein